MVEYEDRQVICLNCGEGLRVTDAGHMLRFRYLCGDCTTGGYRLELFTDSPLPPRRWYVHVTLAGWIVPNGKNTQRKGV